MFIGQLKNRVRELVTGRSNYHSLQSQLVGKSTKDIFHAIYHKRMWGGIFKGRFYSGTGSADPTVIGPYVKAIRQYVASLVVKPTLVDIGCGDFRVGQLLVEFASCYIACDVVPALIDHNRAKFLNPGLEFRVVDAIRDSLPEGDIVIFRQVLQHLSNADVEAILPKLAQYRTAIITENLPSDPDFVPNKDVPTGLDTRVRHGSALVLTEAPFHLSAKASRILCAVPSDGGIIMTMAYEF